MLTGPVNGTVYAFQVDVPDCLHCSTSVEIVLTDDPFGVSVYLQSDGLKEHDSPGLFKPQHEPEQDFVVVVTVPHESLYSVTL